MDMMTQSIMLAKKPHVVIGALIIIYCEVGYRFAALLLFCRKLSHSNARATGGPLGEHEGLLAGERQVPGAGRGGPHPGDGLRGGAREGSARNSGERRRPPHVPLLGDDDAEAREAPARRNARPGARAGKLQVSHGRRAPPVLHVHSRQTQGTSVHFDVQNILGLMVV